MTRAAADSYFDRVYALVATIPPGKVTTYGEIARALGANRGARAVGYALRVLPDAHRIPWWRVVNAQGAISPRGAGHGAEIQREMLDAEGVAFRLDGTIDLERFGVTVRAAKSSASA